MSDTLSALERMEQDGDPFASNVIQDFLAEQEPTEVVINLNPKQLRVFASAAQVTLALAGIRSGKTHVGALKSIFYAMDNPCAEDEVHLICSPTYPMSKVPTEKVFKLLFDRTIFPVCPLLRYIKSERTFVLTANGGGITRLRIVSLSDADRLRGIKALSAWIDEAAYVSAYAWEIVQGRLADSNGPCWLTTTPSGYNWVYELYDRALKGDKSIRVVHWESTENTFIRQDGIEALSERYDERTHAQEIGARFVRGRGLVYRFSRSRNLVRGEFNRSKPIYIGQDFNVDPMASVVSQPFTTSDGVEGLHVLWCREAMDSDTQRLCDWLDYQTKEWGFKQEQAMVYPDAAGAFRSTSGKSDFRILRQAGYRVSAAPRNPRIKDRVNCVNGMLAPRGGKPPRLLIDPRAQRLVECLEKQPWAKDTDPPEPDKTMGFDHLTDALGYKCWRRYPLRNSTQIGRAA